MKTEQIAETWTGRKAADEARHLAACVVCREHLRPANDQKLYAVKNSKTRQFTHVLVNGESLESKLGWSHDEILYSMLLEDGAPKGPPMSEETKVKLRGANEKRKAENKLKRVVRANTPARLVEGEPEEREEEEMSKKKSKKVRTARVAKKAVKTRASNGADAFLPAKFTRKHGGEDHIFERDGEMWRLDGKEPLPLRKCMAKLIGEANARATSFVRYFRVDKIVAA